MRTRADSPSKTCTMEGCERPLRARGMCSTHYNQTRYTSDERHQKVTVPCTQCGKPCVKGKTRAKRYGGLFCSYDCRDAWRKETGNNPGPSAEARAKGRVVLDSRMWRAKAKLRKAARGTRGSYWVAGWCERCGRPFVSILKGGLIGRYCSDLCVHRASKSRRRARVRGAHHERYSRHQVFERDAWRCHICKRKTLRAKVVPHPRAPVIDHLVPLAEGGDDTAANVATACFLCNSIKRECGGGEQLALIG